MTDSGSVAVAYATGLVALGLVQSNALPEALLGDSYQLWVSSVKHSREVAAGMHAGQAETPQEARRRLENRNG